MTETKSKPQLKEIVNVPETVKAFGRTYEIAEFNLGQAAQALEHIGLISFLIKKAQHFPRTDDGRLQVSMDEIIDLLTIAVSGMGPSMLGLISIATREPIEWLETQKTMDGLRIFAKVVEKNLDFFSQQNLSQFKEMFAGLTARVLGTGGEQSTN